MNKHPHSTAWEKPFKKCLLAACVGAVLATSSHAQDESSASSLDFEEVIVTGVSSINPLTKLESSVAITTKNEEAIAQKGPLNLVDLVSVVPGFWAESSGGESGAGNVFIRGLPQDGGFIFMQQLEDGLPVLNEPSINFLPVDGFSKLDETIERFEAVRGGSAAIFATGAPGGMVNLVSKDPTDTPETRVKVQVGDYNHVRTDFVHTGPISDDWGVMVGGFYRQDDGVRDPGFTANQGYQFRVKLARELDNGRLWFDAKKLDDSGIFYLPIAVENPNSSGGNPGDDINSIPGTDAGTFTATSSDWQRIRLRQTNGERTPDMSDGIGADSNQFTIGLELELDDGWYLDGGARHLSGDFSFISGISVGQPIRGDELIDDLITTAQGLGGSADDRYNGTDGVDFSTLNAGLIRYTNSGAAFDPVNQNGNGLTYESGFWDVRWDVDNFVTDWKLSKAFGDHNLTFGLYFGQMKTTVLKDWANVIHDIKDRTELIDVLLFNDINGNGQIDDGEESVSRTENGVWRYGFDYQQNTEEMRSFALYFSDEWDVTDDFRVDFGARYDENVYNGVFGVSPGSQDFDGNTVDGVFLATDGVAVAAPQRFDDYKRSLNELSFTVAANYSLTDNQAIFARYALGYDFPKAIDTIRVTDQFTGEQVEASEVTQTEVGYKLSLDTISIFSSAFFSTVEDQVFNDNIVVDGQSVQTNELYGTETFGIEAEIVWNPVDNFDLQATITLQQPEYDDFVTSTDDFSGNSVRRIPEEIFSITPTYRFGDAGYVYLTYFNGGDRFIDFANELEIAGYDTIDAGVNYYLSENITFRLQGFNLTDSTGLTEGNPRGQSFGDNFVARPILGRHFRASVTFDF